MSVLGAPPGAVTGTVDLMVQAGEELSVDLVAFHIDGEWRAITNARPFRFPWDTSYEEPGPHVITVEGMNAASVTVVEKKVSVIVAPRD